LMEIKTSATGFTMKRCTYRLQKRRFGFVPKFLNHTAFYHIWTLYML
jgi:hypothetical protein